MVTKKWMSRMLGCLLGAAGVLGMSESSFADPPWGHAPNRGVVVTPNGFYHGNVNRHYVPQPHYHYHYGSGYGNNRYWGYPSNFPCQPIYRTQPYSHHRPSNPGRGVGGWPTGPSFGGGFPNGPSYGGGVNVWIGR